MTQPGVGFQHPSLKEGILRGVFRQKAAAAWFGCRAEKAQVTVMLRGGSDVNSWLDQVNCMSHSWPKSCNIGKMQAEKVHAKTFHLHRKFTRARNMWLSLRPNWYLLRYHMYTDWPGIYLYDELNDRLFVNPGRNDNIMILRQRPGTTLLSNMSGSVNSTTWPISLAPSSVK